MSERKKDIETKRDRMRQEKRIRECEKKKKKD